MTIYLTSMVALSSLSPRVSPILVCYEFGVLFNVAAFRSIVVVTVADLAVLAFVFER